jgi:hypothetical protein
MFVLNDSFRCTASTDSGVTVWNAIPVYSADNVCASTSVLKTARFCFLFARNQKGRAPRQRNKAVVYSERGSVRRATGGRMAQCSELLQSAWLRLS